MRVVLDTNVIFSALYAGGTPFEVLSLVEEGEIRLIISPFLLQELERNLKKKLTWLPPEVIEAFLAYLSHEDRADE